MRSGRLEFGEVGHKGVEAVGVRGAGEGVAGAGKRGLARAEDLEAGTIPCQGREGALLGGRLGAFVLAVRIVRVVHCVAAGAARCERGVWSAAAAACSATAS